MDLYLEKNRKTKFGSRNCAAHEKKIYIRFQRGGVAEVTVTLIFHDFYGSGVRVPPSTSFHAYFFFFFNVGYMLRVCNILYIILVGNN